MTPLFSNALLRTQSDERLLLLVGQGSERAFEAIVDRYRRPLQRHCERVLTRQRAEDVVQQVLIKAWVALQNGAEVRSLKAWLYRIARTTILDAAQAPGYDYDELERSLRPPSEPDSEVEQRTVIRKTLAGLAALPEAQREALLRTAIDGQSRAEIAQALGVSEGAVRQLVHRARATLRAAATAVTPLPLVNWLATVGQGASGGGGALEGGAAGSAGVVGLAKASAMIATVGAIAGGAGPSAIHHHKVNSPGRAEVHAKAEGTKGAPVELKTVSPPSATAEADHGQAGEQSRQEGDRGDSQNHDRAEGDSHQSRGDGSGEADRHVSQPERDQGDAEQPSNSNPVNGGDSAGGDPASSDSGDSGD